MSLLTFRPSRTGDLVAAYLGRCRVGYAQRAGRPERGWIWDLKLLRPEGGLYMGREPDLEGCQRALEACTAAWVASAGLRPAEASAPQEPLCDDPGHQFAVAKGAAARKKKSSRKGVAASEI